LGEGGGLILLGAPFDFHGHGRGPSATPSKRSGRSLPLPPDRLFVDRQTLPAALTVQGLRAVFGAPGRAQRKINLDTKNC
jgi:hypothetical protein